MQLLPSAQRRARAGLVGLIAAALAGATLVAQASPTSAGLLSVLCPVTNTLGVTSAGWDDGVTTTPTTMAQVDQAIGAAQLQSRGVTGAGIGVALIDSGVVPVQGLSGAGKTQRLRSMKRWRLIWNGNARTSRKPWRESAKAMRM
jgi:serine protease AprX